VFFPVQATDLKDSDSAKAITERHEAWNAELPKEDHALWDWLETLDESRRTALLAHCVSFGVNALYEKGDRYSGSGISAHGVQQRILQADRLAFAVGLDMVEAGWRPTVDNYLGRVTKPRILEAVREAKGEQAAQLIDHLKKAEMAREAERLLEGTGWLPEPLRTQRVDEQPPEEGEPGQETGTLPEFLNEDEDGHLTSDDDDPKLVTVADE
jgi:ParB family chromosome partitioning protein